MRNFILLSIASLLVSCSLNQKSLDSISDINTVSNESIAAGMYSGVRGVLGGDWAGASFMEELQGDLVYIPTRGDDWFDNGNWLAVFGHTQTASTSPTSNAFNNLQTGISKINTAIAAFAQQGSNAQVYYAQAITCRALLMYYMMDLYGQTLYRPYTETDYSTAAGVLTREQSVDTIVMQLGSVLPMLPTKAKFGEADQSTACMILSKIYLNYPIYMPNSSGSVSPYDSVIKYTTMVIDGDYSLAPQAHYFDIFGPDNVVNAATPEIIFAVPMDNTNPKIGGYPLYHATLHYNQRSYKYTNNWNGMSATPVLTNFFERTNNNDFVNAGNTGVPTVSDDRLVSTGDIRSGTDIYINPKDCGVLVGLLKGQQYNYFTSSGVFSSTSGPQFPHGWQPVDTPTTRDKNGSLPLVYRDSVSLNLSGKAAVLEVGGVRLIKYRPSVDPTYDAGKNGFVVFRLADAFLMRSEAYYRKNGAGDPNAIADMNTITQRATGKDAPALTDEFFLAEMAREFYTEGHRRTDLIRFDKFETNYTMGDFQRNVPNDINKRLLPIPSTAISANPNLKQNPGY